MDDLNNTQNARTLTKGQKMVKLSFNPSGNVIVDTIKQHHADLIDLLLTTIQPGERSDKAKEINIAIQHLQTSSMFAVTAQFTE